MTEVAGDTVVSFTLGLKRPEQASRDALRAVADPRSPSYRHFPSRKSIRKQFGAYPADLKAVRKNAGKRDLKVILDDTGVFAIVKGKAKDFQRWLGGDPLAQIQVPGVQGGTGILITVGKQAQLPAAVRDRVASFIPLDFRFTYPNTEQSGVQGQKQQPFSGVNRGTPEGCIEELRPELNTYTYSYNELLRAYGVDDLGKSSRLGRNTRVAIMAQGVGFSDVALGESRKCFGLPGATFMRVPVTGTQGVLPEGPEGDLDVQVVQSVLPRGAQVMVMESDGRDQREYLPYAALFALPELPDVTTDSHSNCENQYFKGGGPAIRRLTDAVMRRVTLAGTSLLSAAGDSGSSACWDQDNQTGPEHIAVNYTPASPLVTAVGGSRIVLKADNTRKNEVAWNDTAGPFGGEILAGGGGHSRIFQRPWWQLKLLTHADMRALPDLVAHASAGPGWPLFMNNPAGFEPAAGTSAASPFTAASFGLIAADQRDKGRPPLGQLQPLLYHLQASQPNTFVDITKGSTDLFKVGCCTAKVGYDTASGLGAPRLQKIAASVPKPG